MSEVLYILLFIGSGLYSFGAILSAHRKDFARAAWRMAFACWLSIPYNVGGFIHDVRAPAEEQE